jgi:hypothetical protein
MNTLDILIFRQSPGVFKKIMFSYLICSLPLQFVNSPWIVFTADSADA